MIFLHEQHHLDCDRFPEFDYGLFDFGKDGVDALIFDATVDL